MKFGYKASAEQFDPRTLLKYSVLAEELGFDFCLHQRSPPAVAAHWRPRAVRILLDGRAG